MPEKLPDAPEPTAADRRNAEMRQAISERQRAEYENCLRLSLALGKDYTPWMKLALVESDYHRKQDPVYGPTVYKVYRGEERLTENSVFVMEKDGRVLFAKRYEDLLKDVLNERHATYGFEKDGEWVPYDRWCVTWGAVELYEPKSAEQLAAGRARREQKKVEKEEREWAEANPLFQQNSD